MGLLKKLSTRSKGIVPRTLRHLFSQIEGGSGTITLSIVQIYLETVYDLLNPDLKALTIREGVNGDVFIQNLITVPISDYSQAVNLLNAGLENRVLAS
jgi:hypothetical protein